MQDKTDSCCKEVQIFALEFMPTAHTLCGLRAERPVDNADVNPGFFKHLAS